MKAAFEQGPVFPAEAADAIVVGMLVGAEEAHRHMLVGEPLDAPAAEGARRIAKDEQPEHHPRRILRAARPPPIDPRRAQVQHGDGVEDEMDQVIGRHPIPQIRRQEQWSIVIDGDKTRGHPPPTPPPCKGIEKSSENWRRKVRQAASRQTRQRVPSAPSANRGQNQRRDGVEDGLAVKNLPCHNPGVPRKKHMALAIASALSKTVVET